MRRPAWLRYFGIGSSYLIETQGRTCAIWKVGKTRRRRTNVSNKVAIEEKTLRAELRRLGYWGQPATVILHPPVVAVKMVAIGAEKPETWLAAHLSEISPPGNRRDLAMVHHAVRDGQLVAVFGHKSELRRLLTTLQDNGIAIDSIVPAALFVLKEFEESTNAECDAVRFVLGQYRVGEEGKARTFQVELPKESSDRESCGHTAAIFRKYANCIRRGSSRHRQGFACLDFLPQFGLPRALATRDLSQAIKVMSFLLLVIVIVVTGLWATQLVSGNAQEHLRLQETYRALDETEAENAGLEESVERLAAMRSVRVDLPRLLSIVARATPAICWLGSLQLQSDARSKEVVFSLSGYSREEKEPQAFAAALCQSPGIESVTLERVSRSEYSAQAEHGALAQAVVFRFEMTGSFSDAK
ncbi:MAG: hypothetical protein IT585_07830 [candidate division Zixibacteria bacterium]|nr:hypothetical protein [candidate division Zixibacteria bacterium]